MQKKKLIIGVTAVVLAFAAGVGAGGSGKAPASAAVPAPVVTVTPVPSPAVTVTAEPVVKTVEKTPQACLDALDRAGSAIGFMSDIGPLSGKAVQAAFIRDAAGLEAITSQVQALNDRLKKATPGIASASQECRAGAK